jgi:hypothetical protein
MANGTDQALEERLKTELAVPKLTSPELDDIEKRRTYLGQQLDRLQGPQGLDDTILAGIAEGVGREDIRSALVPGTTPGVFGAMPLPGQSPESIRNARNQLVEHVTREIGGLGGRELTARKNILTKRTEDYGRQLLSQQPQLEAAIDQRLATMLEEVGFRADVGRQQVGAALAGRGLIRGTAGSKAVGSVTLAEQAERAQQRLQASQQKSQVERVVGETFGKIRTARRQSEQAKTLAEIRSMDDIVFEFDAKSLQDRVSSEIERMQLDSANAEISKGILTGIGGVIGAVVGGIATGGTPVGIAGGAAVGGAAGGVAGEAMY